MSLWPGPQQLFQQGDKIAGEYSAVKRNRFCCQSNDQIISWKSGAPTTKLLADDAFDPVAVDSPFQQLLADHHAETSLGLSLGSGLVVQHQQLAANRLPETKNG